MGIWNSWRRARADTRNNTGTAEPRQQTQGTTQVSKRVEPSVKETAFSCPHCGALTTQHWCNLFADNITSDKKLPAMPDASFIADIESDKDLDRETKDRLTKYVKRVMTGDLFLGSRKGSSAVYPDFNVENLHLSHCYNCHEVSVWLHDRLIYPATRAGVEPNDDLDADIKRDFEEARSILDQSPRGAAALLRLALQKLCKQLGESGDNIDKDIASLVGKGLNPTIQKALDVVRVVGNEAVHPGTLDLRDDRDTALKLFELINSIAQQMITHPKEVDALYGMLPEAKRAGIDARNAKALEKKD